MGDVDEMKIALNSKFMRGIVTKLLAKLIFKKTGYEVDIQINELKAVTTEGKVRIHVDVDAEANKDEFVKMIKSAGLD